MKIALFAVTALLVANSAMAARCAVNAGAADQIAAATAQYVNEETALLQEAQKANDANVAAQIVAGKKMPANRANKDVVTAVQKNSTTVQLVNEQLAAAYAQYMAVFNSLTVECGK